jgi:hypothetical protein
MTTSSSVVAVVVEMDMTMAVVAVEQVAWSAPALQQLQLAH